MSLTPIRYSVVVPVFCEADCLVELCDRIEKVFAGIGSSRDFELLIVDDGSTDKTPAVLQQLTRERSYLRVITFRTNCGKALALMAGFQYAAGDIVITMDGDLQDNPEDIPVLLDKLREGYDLVSGWRQSRAETFVRKLGSKIYNAAVVFTTGLKIHDTNCGFKAYKAEVTKAVCIYGHYHRYIPVFAHLVGFKVGEASIPNSKRKHGTSKYYTFRYEGLLDLLSLLFLHRYGLRPLHFFGTISLALLVPGLLALTVMIFRHGLYLLGFGEEYILANRPLLSISVLLILTGVIVFLTGFVCDFTLHHQIRKIIKEIVDLRIIRKTDRSSH